MAQNKKITELVGAQPRSGFLFVVADANAPTVENYKVDYADISGQLGGAGVCGDSYQIQFNSGDACGADPYFIYNYDDGYVAIGEGCELLRASGCTVDIFGSLYVQGTGTGDCTGCLPSGGLISGWTGIHDFFSGNTGHVRDEVIVGTGLNLLKASGDLVEISGDLRVSGEVWITGADGQFCQVNCGSGGGAGFVWSLNGLRAYYNAGNVGIGTSHPTTSLVVGGTTTISGDAAQFILRSNDYNIATLLNDGVDEGQLVLQDSSVTRVRLTSNPSNPSYINAGNVGIGLDTPTNPLHVRGPDDVTALNGALTFHVAGGDEVDDYINIGFSNADSGPLARIGAKVVQTGANPGSTGELHFAVQNGNTTNTLVSLVGLHVGIGTVNPQAALHVTGTSGILAPSGVFTESLTISGVPVATGAGGGATTYTAGTGLTLVGTEFNTSGTGVFDQVSGASGVFTDTLTISGVSVATGAGGGGGAGGVTEAFVMFTR